MLQVPDSVTELAEALAAAGGLKLWSLLVTLLGDQAVNQQAATLLSSPGLSGAQLSALVARIGLQPSAMRVALHRLGRDGWLVSQRQGRQVNYRLSARALAETHASAPGIYAIQPPAAAAVTLLLAADSQRPDPPAGTPPSRLLALAPRLWLLSSGTPDDAPTLSRWAATQGLLAQPFAPAATTPLPAWLATELREQAYWPEAQRLLELIAPLDPTVVADDEGRRALRLLLLHAWRRLVLRADPLADQLLRQFSAPSRAGDHPGPLVQLRQRIGELLAQLPAAPLT